MKGDESTQETEEGHKVNKWWQKQKIHGLKMQKPKVRSDKRRSRSRSLIRKRGVG